MSDFNIKPLKNTVIPICLVIIASILVTAALYLMKPVLVPFTFSLFLFFIVAPIIDWLRKKVKMPKSLAMLTSFIVLIMILVGIVLLLGVSLKGFVKSSDEYQIKLLALVDQFSVFSSSHGVNIDLSLIRESVSKLPILDWVRHVSGSVVGIMGTILLVFVITMLLLMGKETGSDHSIMDEEVQSKITRYIATKCMTSAMTGLCVFIVLVLFKVQLALMFGILTFFLNFIPNIGSLIALLLPLPIVFLQFGLSLTLIWVTIFTAVIQFVIGNIIDPKVMGENLGLHPAIILLSLLFWGFIWGVPGMFLSVPMTAIIKLLLSRSKKTQSIAKILEGHFK